MPKLRALSLTIFTLTAACTSNDDASTEAGTGSTASSGGTVAATDASTAPTTGATPDSTSGESMTGDTAPTTGGAETTSGSSGAGESTGPGTTTGDTTIDTTTGDAEVYDPNLDGPWTIAEVEGEFMVGGVAVPMDAFYPTGGPEAGPYPVVVIAHGFQLPAAQYTSYAKRLATHGYVALTADFQAGFLNPDHVAFAKQVLGGIDWAAQEATLAGVADTNNVGLTGHSLGGKISVLGAILDERVRASITLDPVDSSVMCDPVKCPDVSDMLPTDIPLAFLGETVDGMGGFMPCAPAADNFLTFYAKASTPALAVTVKGANHMSFIDDVASCGITCSFCQAATLDNATVNALSRAYVVAFYGRHLRLNAGYDTYLTGAEAKQRYVDLGQIAIQAK
jgi:fermentation-respiration switch protein FrsA (DUF1100 family)